MGVDLSLLNQPTFCTSPVSVCLVSLLCRSPCTSNIGGTPIQGMQGLGFRNHGSRLYISRSYRVQSATHRILLLATIYSRRLLRALELFSPLHWYHLRHWISISTLKICQPTWARSIRVLLLLNPPFLAWLKRNFPAVQHRLPLLQTRNVPPMYTISRCRRSEGS